VLTDAGKGVAKCLACEEQVPLSSVHSETTEVKAV